MLWASFIALSWASGALGCTNYLLTKGATVEHVNRITYSADSYALYGALYHYPAGTHAPGTVSGRVGDMPCDVSSRHTLQIASTFPWTHIRTYAAALWCWRLSGYRCGRSTTGTRARIWVRSQRPPRRIMSLATPTNGASFGGLSQLQSQPGALIDYGSLIYIALQRSRTAREAIVTMTTLVDEYGYASEGESFSLADQEEVSVLGGA
jgi:hypothetical protein